MQRKMLIGVLVMVFSLGALLPMTAGEDIVKTVTASIDPSLTLFWDSRVAMPTDENGTILHPIEYNDRLYVPLRYFAERAGYSVTWDFATNSVSLVSPPANNNPANNTPNVVTPPASVLTYSLLKDLNPYQADNNFTMGSVDINGKRYMGAYYNDSPFQTSASWQIDKKYSSLKIVLGSCKSFDKAQTVWIMGDDQTIFNSPTIDAGYTNSFNIDVTGFKKLTIMLGPNAALLDAQITTIPAVQ